MRVLHVIGAFNPRRREGGLQEATLQLCHGLKEHGVSVEIATTNAGERANLDVTLERPLDVDGVVVRYFRRSPMVGFLPSAALAQHLRRAASGYDVIHITGLFTFPTAAAARIAHHARVPFVITPSGMCRPWALAYRGSKKSLYWRTVERRTLQMAAGIHATSEAEAATSKRCSPVHPSSPSPTRSRSTGPVVPSAIPAAFSF